MENQNNDVLEKGKVFIFNNEEKQILSAIDRKHHHIDDDAKMILSKLPVLNDLVDEERDRSNKSLEGVYPVVTFKQDVDHYIKCNFKNYLFSLSLFFSSRYNHGSKSVYAILEEEVDSFNYVLASKAIFSRLG